MEGFAFPPPLWLLEYGMKHSSDLVKNEQALIRFLAPLSILPFGAVAASEYGNIRSYLQSQGTPIEPLDMLIAAHAKAEDMTLVTKEISQKYGLLLRRL